MDHNLGDTLNLEGEMSSMDFDHSNVVEQTNSEDVSTMEFKNIEEEQMMMDTGSEEIIVSDFIGDPLTLQDYCISNQELQQQPQNETILQTSQLNVLTPQAQSILDIQYEPEDIKFIKHDSSHQQTKYITVKAANTIAKNIAPKQVMIAPKPPNFPSTGAQKSVLAKQYAIAPKPASKPVQLVKSSVMKVSLADLVQGTNTKPVLAQLGGKLVMLPARGTQKIKLLPASSGAAMHYVKSVDQQSQVVATKVTQISKQTKPVVTKVTVQGQTNVDTTNQPAVLTKLVPVATTTSNPQARYVMQQKTVPISLAGNKIIITSPTKQSNLKFAKTQQLITVSTTPKLLPAPAQAATAKKVVISANPNSNVIMKSTPTKTVGSKDSSLLLTQGQRTQLHQISVPGKGVQYIRLVSNNPTAKSKTAATGNTFMIADAKGNLIPVTAEKMGNNQPPLLVITGNVAGANKVAPKSPKKLVRLAPIGSKPPQVTPQMRSSQSLLAPMSPAQETTQSDDFVHATVADEQTVSIADVHTMMDDDRTDRVEEVKENVQMSLLAQNAEIHKFGDDYSMNEVTVDFERHESMSPTEEVNTSEDHNEEGKQNIHPLIVIPPNYKTGDPNSFKEKTLVFLDEGTEDTPEMEEEEENQMASHGNNMVNVEAEIVPYTSPSPPPMLSDSEMVRSNDLGRPRKACNCTKSQCLKLYCDCFANGEFCNSCNCNNCHNNLENEELRQKAIRSCLDRNPNAFRPKIGKAKSGGPEIVRRHTKGCNCKRSGCLKNYCECFEAKIECTATCKCVGCRNVEDASGKRRTSGRAEPGGLFDPMYRPPHNNNYRLPCSFMTSEVIEAVCQCLIAAAVEAEDHDKDGSLDSPPDPMKDVIEEFARCLQDIIGASHQAAAPALGDE